ncbi:MAG: hypothetical protein LBK99_27450 [Opitutaceae bacterium]|jgi:hypothetical protein|nr:hypothetical protein [Opitutaceae bacterium]
MDATTRQLVWDDLRKRAAAAGFVKFDHAGVLLLCLTDDVPEPPPIKTTTTLPGFSAPAPAPAPVTGSGA